MKLIARTDEGGDEEIVKKKGEASLMLDAAKVNVDEVNRIAAALQGYI